MLRGSKAGARARRSVLVLRLLLGAAWAGAGYMPALAQTSASRSFDIPAGSLSDGITRFGQQSGLQVAVHEDVIRGARTGGVQGAMAPEAALQRLLAGSGFTYSIADGSTVTLQPLPATREGAISLGPVRVEAQNDLASQRAAEDPSGPANGYVASKTRTGAKTATSLLEVPQSVTVISAAQIRAQDVQTVGQALRYSAGVQAEPYGFDSRYDQFLVRGFPENSVGKYRDGMRQLNSSFAFFQDEPYGLERIEILRGPSSVLYGANAPGGVVNTVSKMPTDTTFGEVIGQVGSYDRFQGQFDFGGPLTDDGAVSYRLTGLARDSQTQVRFGKDDRQFIAPAVTWKIDDRTKLTVLAEYQQNEGTMWPYYLMLPTGLSNIVLTDPNYDRLNQHQWAGEYLFEHQFDDNFTFRSSLRYAKSRFLGRFVDADSLAADGHTLLRYAGQFQDHADALTTDNQLEAKFDTGALSHTFLAGVDYAGNQTGLNFGLGNAPSLDLLNPVYSLTPVTGVTTVSRSAGHTNQTGVYFQDQIRIDRLTITAGGRQDWAHTVTQNRVAGTATSKDDDAFSGRIGATYQFDIGLAPYVSYATSFSPIAGTSFAGSAFKPTTGEAVEAGVKFQPADINSFITASVFQTTQNNLLTTDPAHTLFSIQTGQARSQGFELQGVASLVDGLDAVASYTYTDVKVTRSNGPDLNKRLVGAPANLASLWLDYTLPEGDLRGFGFGGGVRYVGRTFQNTTNTLSNPDYTVFDAVVHYDWHQYRIALNASNLGDRREPDCISGNCTFTMGRSLIGSVSYRW